jgi:4-hydroxybenzoate polyprenyltransferase
MFKKSFIFDYFLLMRPTLLIPVWTFLFLGYFWGSNIPFLGCSLVLSSRFWLTLLSYSLLLSSIYIVNQIFDLESDRVNKKLFLLPENIISIKSAWIFAAILVFGSGLIGIFIGRNYLFLWSISLVMGILYSVPPAIFKGKPFLDLFFNSCGYGLINFLVGWNATVSRISSKAFIHAIPYMLSVGAVFLNTTIPDIPGDRQVGEITTGVFLGRRKTAIFSFTLLLFSAAISLYLTDLFALLGAILALPLFFLVITEKKMNFFSKISYRLGGGIFVVIFSFRFPLFLLFGITVFLSLKLYYKKRFNLNYPSITGT